MSHPIPDSLESQCIPRICWGKFVKNNEKYELTLNITVSHKKMRLLQIQRCVIILY